MRLFVALDPPAPVRDALAALQTDVPGARWTPPEKMHLTLHFLGNVADEQVAPLEAALAGVAGRAFPVTVEGLGAFPSRRAARVLVAQVAVEPGLAHLHERVGTALLDAGIVPESRPFRPHLTLARLKEPDRQAVQTFLAQPVPSRSFEARAFYLYASETLPEGARYTRLRSFPLA